MASHSPSETVLARKKIRRSRISNILRCKYLYMMILPGIIWYIVFCYIPMYGISIAFMDYQPWNGFFESPWVGLGHFKRFFSSAYFVRIFTNTLVISLAKIALGFPAPIIFALMLNELRSERFKRVVQTISYLPHFLSWVVVAGMATMLLSPTNGTINEIIKSLGGNPIFFLGDPEYFRGTIVISDIWKGFGWGAIIYLAALTGVDPQLYEAAVVDGANRWHKLVHITLPSIASTIVIMLILRVGGIMDAGFEQILLLYSPQVYSTGDVIATYVYREGLINHGYSFSTAVGLFNSVIAFVMLYTTNKIANRLGQGGIW